jgi:hypothetical protein
VKEQVGIAEKLFVKRAAPVDVTDGKIPCDTGIRRLSAAFFNDGQEDGKSGQDNPDNQNCRQVFEDDSSK